MLELLRRNGDDKKVEYVELIYDLIFVYLIGRSNALLELGSGFFTGTAFFSFLISNLVILQVWYFSTLFINRYGTNGIGDHIFLFINMYLLYYLADGISRIWSAHYVRYCGAWGLILLNLALQYLRRLRRSHTPWEQTHLRIHMILLFIQAAIVLGSIPLYSATGLALAWVCLLFGFIAGFFTEKADRIMPVNFEHLSERVMLFVVFTFGEMIVCIAEYFHSALTLSSAYFSLMAFLIVAGLFVSYGFLYNRVIDRERTTSGTVYMLIHIVLIAALNCITVALGFMPDPDILQGAKTVFLVCSFLAYYLFLFFIGYYAKGRYRAGWRFFLILAALCLLFAALTLATHGAGYLSIGISVLFVYAVLGMILLRWYQVKKDLPD